MVGGGGAEIGRKEEVEFAGAHAADLTDAGVRGNPSHRANASAA